MRQRVGRRSLVLDGVYLRTDGDPVCVERPTHLADRDAAADKARARRTHCRRGGLRSSSGCQARLGCAALALALALSLSLLCRLGALACGRSMVCFSD